MWGFVQSILAIVPETVTGFVPSYSAAKEWCAESPVAPRRPNARITAGFMSSSPTRIVTPCAHASSTVARELVGFLLREAFDGSIPSEMAGRRDGGCDPGSSNESGRGGESVR